MNSKERPNRCHSVRPWDFLFRMVALTVLLLLSTGVSFAATSAQNEKLASLVEAAKKEDVIDFSCPASLTPKGAQTLIAGLNKKYSLNLKMNYIASTNYPAIAAQVITEIQSGQPPAYDLVYLTEVNLVKIFARRFLDPFDWMGTFGHITKDSVYFDNGGILIATIFGLPIYNTNLVKGEDIPRKWEDLLSPKWKGKILVPKYVQVWQSLSSVWGEEKTVAFLKRLKGQDPLYVLYPEIQTRLASGEYLIAANQVSPFVEEAKRRGMPIDYADKVTPVPVLFDMMGVPKRARHPNAARLLNAFSLTPEGQEMWANLTGRSSLFVSGTPASKFVQGKELLFRDMKALAERPDDFEKSENRLADVLDIR